MMLFDKDGVIRRFETPEDVLKEFYHLRLEYYVKRKAHMLKVSHTTGASNLVDDKLVSLKAMPVLIAWIILHVVVVHDPSNQPDTYHEFGMRPLPRHACCPHAL